MLKEKVIRCSDARRARLPNKFRDGFYSKIKYKNAVKRSMMLQGASTEFINSVLKDEIIEFALNKGFTAEALAWSLMQ